MSKNKQDNKYMRIKRKDSDQFNALEPNNEDNNASDTSKLKRNRNDVNTINSSIINSSIPIVENGLTGSNEEIRFNNIYEVDSGNNDSSSTSTNNNSNSSSNNNSTDIILPKDILQISWGKIVTAFTSMFGNVFTVNSKLYFDVVSQKIDGATVKWCPIILLDTLISMATENAFKLKCNETLKRKFNQYNALHKTVCDIVSETYVANSFSNLIKSNNNTNNIEVFPTNLYIIDIPNEWQTPSNFKNHTCHQISSSKSNYKMIEIVNNLISHNIIKENGIIVVIKTVVSTIYKQHFNTIRVNNIVDSNNQDLIHYDEHKSSTIDNR